MLFLFYIKINEKWTENFNSGKHQKPHYKQKIYINSRRTDVLVTNKVSTRLLVV